MKRILAFALVLGLAACASRQSVERNFVLSPSADKALVVFSISHDRAHGGLANAQFQLDAQDSVMLDASYDSRRMGGLFNGYHPSELRHVYGRLYAVTMEPGRYRWQSWRLGNAWGEDFSGSAEDNAPAFTVSAGEVVYVGNQHVNLDIRANDEGVLVPVSAHAELRDESERDLALFELRYPNAGKATVRIGEPGRWSSAK